MSLNTDRLPVGKKKEVDLADAYSEPANFLEIEGKKSAYTYMQQE